MKNLIHRDRFRDTILLYRGIKLLRYKLSTTIEHKDLKWWDNDLQYALIHNVCIIYCIIIMLINNTNNNMNNNNKDNTQCIHNVHNVSKYVDMTKSNHL